MKKQIFQYFAKAAVTLSVFVAFLGAGTASVFYMYQPKVPKSLLK